MRICSIIGMLTVFLAGCSKSVDSESKSFTYPLAVGNQWTYSLAWTWEHGNPVKVDTEPYTIDTVVMTIVESDTIGSGVVTYAIHGTDISFPTDEAVSIYLNLPEGLYLKSKKYANTNADGGMPRRTLLPTRAIAGDSLVAKFLNRNWPLSAIPDPAEPIACGGANPADTLPLVLAYPQRTGLYWTYHDSSSTWPYRADKKIEGRETITTSAGRFECWRIRWIYGPPYTGYDLVDFASPEGLIRRRYVRSSSAAGRDVLTFDLISFALH